METYEFEGKTTQEAIENAARELNIPAEELDIDVIEPGSAGIFGLVGGKKARIKVHVSTEMGPDTEMDADTEMGPDTEADADMEVGPDMESGPDVGAGADHENDMRIAKETLENILALIPVETTVNAARIDGKIALNIEGDKSGLLIGRRGKTLDALEFIVNRAVNKTLEQKIRVVVDAENYRRRREESLTEMALKMGDKAKKTKKAVTTSPMNPHDRRIVHLALKEDEQLDTRSRGDGLLKKVIIIPKS